MLMLTACGAMDATPPAEQTAFVAPSLPAHLAASPLVLHPWNAGGAGAAISARLVLEDGCLWLVGEESGGRWVPSFPYPGTDWDGAAVISVDEVVAVGEVAVFGGGESDLTEANLAAYDWIKPPDPDCLVGKGWFVYNGSARP